MSKKSCIFASDLRNTTKTTTTTMTKTTTKSDMAKNTYTLNGHTVTDDFVLTENPNYPFAYQFMRPEIATDAVIFGFDGGQLQILLIKRKDAPFKNKWALPGGFLQPYETVDECVRRELEEETSLRSPYMEQFGVFSEVDRDERWRVVSIAYYSVVRLTEVKGGDDAKDARWFPLDKVPALAFDHNMILHKAIRKMRERMHFEPIGFELLPEKFTMPQLQALYEAMLEIHFDRRNFMKKMLNTGILNDLGEKVETHTNRAPSLYSFNKEQYDRMKKDGTLKLEF